MVVTDLVEKGCCAVETLAMGVATIKIMAQELAMNFQCDNLEFELKYAVQRHDEDIWFSVLRIPTTCLNRIWCKSYRSWVKIEWCVIGALEKGVEIEILQHITTDKVGIIHFVCVLLLKSASNTSRSQESTE